MSARGAFTAGDAAAYSVPAFFVLSIGWVLLSELAAEPYGWTVAGTKIDTGSRVVSLLAPTVLRLVLVLALVAAAVLGGVAALTKGGAAELRRLAGIVSGKRLD